MKKSKILHIEQLPTLDGVKYEEKTTGPLEKFVASFFNAIIALGLSVPFLIIWGPNLYWRKHYTFRQHIKFNIFYTLSFSTIMLYVWFPLDLLILNLLLIQLPMSLITGTTLHGYLSGMETVKIVPKRKE